MGFHVFDPKDTLDWLIQSPFKVKNIKKERIFTLESTWKNFGSISDANT